MKIKRSYIGNYLLEHNMITEEQLNNALRIQKENRDKGKKILTGRLLVDLGYCSVENVTKAIANWMGIPYISIKDYNVDENAVKLLKNDSILNYEAIPIGFNNDKLQVAMMHPDDIIAVDDIGLMTGYEVEPVMLVDYEFAELLFKYTGSSLIGVKSNMQSANENADSVSESFNNVDDTNDEDDSPIVNLANQIFSKAVKLGASDIHVEPMEKTVRIRYRVDGVLVQAMQQPKSILSGLISRLKVMSNMNIAEKRIPQDGRMTILADDKKVDVRAACMPSIYGEKITLRLLEREQRVLDLVDLGFPVSELSRFKEAIKKPYGFVLISGPTGSGKSTTLYGSLLEINSIEKNIITVENPVERRIPGITQIQTNEAVGMDFANSLKSIVRNDPDIIMVGEIRDTQTAKMAIESAMTGHMVFSTIHTNDAASSITRLTEMGIEPFLSASAIALVVAQRLVRRLCEHCKEEYTLSNEELSLFENMPIDRSKEVKAYRPKGCYYCNKTGYKKRVGIFEFLFIDEQIRKLIINKASSQEISDYAKSKGMKSLKYNSLLKVINGETSIEEVARVII